MYIIIVSSRDETLSLHASHEANIPTMMMLLFYIIIFERVKSLFPKLQNNVHSVQEIYMAYTDWSRLQL